jgi:sulfur carrier protein
MTMDSSQRLMVRLNGEQCELRSPLTVAALLAQHGYAGRTVAVEINRVIVPRSQHERHLIRDGDHIEIVHAMGGG